MRTPRIFLMKGFTALEIIIVIAILVVAAIIVMSGLGIFKRTSELNSATENGLSFLHEARAKTLSSKEASQYGVHFEENRVVLFKGESFIDTDPENDEFILPSNIEISSISLNGGGGNVIFRRLNGETDQFGTITFRIVSNPNRSRTIQILGSGIASIATVFTCDWALFSNTNINLGGGSVVKSYDSEGAGADDEAIMQTNSIASGTITTQTNTTIKGKTIVGVGGNPNSVIIFGASSTSTKGTFAAQYVPLIKPPLAPQSPPIVPPITPPATNGPSYSLGGGKSDTFNFCTNPVSSISTGTNTTLNIEGSCPINIDFISIGGGSQLKFLGDIGTLNAKSFSTGTNVNVRFPNNVTITTDILSIGGGVVFTSDGAFTITANTLSTGTNVALKSLGGSGSYSTNSFSLGGGSSFLTQGDLSVTAQTFSTGTNVAVRADNGNLNLITNTFSLGGGSAVRATQNSDIDAGDFATGTNVAVDAGNTLDIKVNTLSIGGGSSFRSTTELPKNMHLTIAGSDLFGTGTNVSLIGTIYAPYSDMSMGGGSAVRGSLIVNRFSGGTNISILYDLALQGETCGQ